MSSSQMALHLTSMHRICLLPVLMDAKKCSVQQSLQKQCPQSMVETSVIEKSSKHTLQVTLVELAADMLFFGKIMHASLSMRSRPFLSR